MTKLIYHGTSLEGGLQIARSGAIMSPYEKEIESCKEMGVTQEKTERMAELIANGYPERERETRVRRTSFADLNCALNHALAFDRERVSGGLVLGVEFSYELMRRDVITRAFNGILFIPGKISLELLRELHVTPRAYAHIDRIRQEFDKFNPAYHFLQ